MLKNDFLGSVNFYHKFIKKYADIHKPLNRLLKKNEPCKWNSKCQESFEKLKNSLISKPILKLFNSHLALHIYAAASQIAIRAILKQHDTEGILRPIAFYSRSLKNYEQNYSITELECLAVVDTLGKFYHYIFGKKIIIHTDYAALV